MGGENPVKGDAVNEPDLGRYDEETLERMLSSYRRLAADHAMSGHYALAKWAQRMCTLITLELNQKAYDAAKSREEQLTLDESHYPDGLGSAED